jgi:hypothetical protein
MHSFATLHDRTKFLTVSLLMLLSPAAGWAHPCDADAIKRGMPLLKLHFEADQLENAGVDDTVKELPPIKALKGKGKFDVLEVWGHIYKADYRMHFIYAQVSGSCLLMGQEILEASDPY